MITGPKKKRKLMDESLPEHNGVTYKPCKFCASMDYDMADGDVTKDNVFEPIVCDVCCWGNVIDSDIPIH